MRIAFRDHFLFKIQTHSSSKALSSIRQNDAALVLKRCGALQRYGKTTRWQYVNSVLSKRVFIARQLRRFSFFVMKKKRCFNKKRGNVSLDLGNGQDP